MQWQFHPYVILALVAATVSFLVAYLAWRRRSTLGALPFACLALAIAEWSLGYALELSSANLFMETLWGKVEYLGIAFTPVAWLAFALQYTDSRDARGKPYLTRENLAWLSLVPLITMTLAWTNDLHGWLWSPIRQDLSGAFAVLELGRGSWFWMHIMYSYTLMMLGTILLIRHLLRSPQFFFWGQTGVLLFGVSVPWLANAIYVLDLSPIPYLDLTPFAFTLGNSIIAWGIFRYALFDLAPVARDTVIENMSDGVIVLDMRHRVVDINSAAQKIIGRSASNAIGQTTDQVFSMRADLVKRFRDVSEIQEEITDGEDEAKRTYELRISPLFNRGQLSGRVVTLRDITDRKRAEEYARGIIDNSLDVIVTTDRERRIVEFNRAAQEAFGYTRDEMLGKQIDMLYATPQEGELIREAIGKAGKFIGEISNLRKNGEIFVSLLSAATLRGAQGEIWGTVGVSRDITERRQAEDALKESEERYRTLFENLPIPVFTKDLEGRYTSCNPENRKYWSVDPVGHTDAELLPPEIALSLRTVDERVVKEQIPLLIEEHFNAPFGPRTVLSCKVPLRDHAGNVSGILGASLDITERKRLGSQIQAERDFALQVMSMMGQGLTITDAESRFVFVNPAYSQMMGYTPEEIIGKRPRDVTLPEDVVTLEQARAERRQLKTTTYETRLVRKDGSIVPVLITGVPRPSSEGKYAGAIAVITDLTEQKRTEEQLRYLGTHDALTGLYNRAYFETELTRLSKSRHYPISIVMVDADNMKVTNDTLGHAAGDELLRRATQVLRRAFRPDDIIARIGGDEFAVILLRTDAPTTESVLARLRQTLDAHNREIPETALSLSLGVATGKAGTALTQVLAVADTAMYHEKNSKRSR